MIGRVYVVGVIVSGTSAGLLAPWSDGGVAAHLGFGLLAILWVSTAVIAWLCWVPNLVVAEWLVVPGRIAPLEPSA